VVAKNYVEIGERGFRAILRSRKPHGRIIFEKKEARSFGYALYILRQLGLSKLLERFRHKRSGQKRDSDEKPIVAMARHGMQDGD
jgi:hypothetical protein